MLDITYRRNRTEAQSAAFVERAQNKRRVRRLRNLRNAGLFLPNDTSNVEQNRSVMEQIVEDASEKAAQRNPLLNYKVSELYELAKNKGLKVTTKMRKAELLAALGVEG